MTRREEERRALLAEAEADLAEIKRRAQVEGWTYDLREAYLSAMHRQTLGQDLHYWSDRDDRAVYYPEPFLH